ncbi:hypothetical protein FGB62_100g10 [Gracilaria domingensis]|nr:hypothetical protein FGB62_100g10 [Gracilaria domingensis]
MVLLALAAVSAAHGWGPGGCQGTVRSAALCCRHEAYRCRNEGGRAPSHCDLCQELCMLVPSETVCVRGGTWPSRRKKCYTGQNWAKVCAMIANSTSQTGSAFQHVDRVVTTAFSAQRMQGKQVEIFALNLAAQKRGADATAASTKSDGKVVVVDRQSRNRNAVTNQIAFLLELMGEVVSALRSASISNTAESVRRNMDRAVSSLQALIVHGRDLVGLVPSNDTALFRTVFDQWISALRVIRVTLRDFIDESASIDELKISVAAITDELGEGFWTRAFDALNAYAAFGQFSADWPPWINAIGQFFAP